MCERGGTVVVACVHRDRVGRNPGECVHARSYVVRQLPSGEDEIHADDRGRALAVGDDERLRDERLARAFGETAARRPTPDR